MREMEESENEINKEGVKTENKQGRGKDRE